MRIIIRPLDSNIYAFFSKENRRFGAHDEEHAASIHGLCHGVSTVDGSLLVTMSFSAKKLCFSPHDWAFRVPKGNCKYARLTIGLQDSYKEN